MTNAEVWKKVEELRMRYEILQADKIPLDLISFVELELRMDLIPYDLLRRTSERMRQSSRTFPAFTSMARSLIGSTSSVVRS